MKNTDALLFLFFIGLLGINWPTIEIFRTNVVLYLFVFWFFLICAIAAVSFFIRDDRR